MALTLERTGRGLFEKSMTFLTIYIICGFGLLVADSLRGVRGTGVGICFFMKRRIVNDLNPFRLQQNFTKLHILEKKLPI